VKCDDLPIREASDGTIAIERRSGKDRRQVETYDLGPLERRKIPDARHLEVAEIELSVDEWEEHFGRQEI
jgi:hypothetical protein